MPSETKFSKAMEGATDFCLFVCSFLNDWGSYYDYNYYYYHDHYYSYFVDLLQINVAQVS